MQDTDLYAGKTFACARRCFTSAICDSSLYIDLRNRAYRAYVDCGESCETDSHLGALGRSKPREFDATRRSQPPKSGTLQLPDFRLRCFAASHSASQNVEMIRNSLGSLDRWPGASSSRARVGVHIPVTVQTAVKCGTYKTPTGTTLEDKQTYFSPLSLLNTSHEAPEFLSCRGAPFTGPGTMAAGADRRDGGLVRRRQ